MKFFQRRVIALILLLLLATTVLSAQDATPEVTPDATEEAAAVEATPESTPESGSAAVTVVGSGIVDRVFTALVEASEVEIEFEKNIAGTNAGITAFCAGQADIALSSRALSAAEEAACNAANLEFVELLVGTDAVVLITNPDVAATCVSTTSLNPLFAPTSNRATDWAQVDPTLTSAPLLVVLPPQDSPVYASLDTLVVGDALRTDAVGQADYAGVVDAVASTSGAVGAVNLATLQSLDNTVKVLQLNENGSCVTPTVAAAETVTYPTVSRLFVYIANSSRVKTGVQDLLAFIATADSATVIQEAGFAAPTEANYAALQEVIGEGIVGRSFSKDVTAFSIADSTTGAVTVGGSASANTLMTTITNTLSSRYPGISATVTLEGEPAGLRDLCSGVVDMVVVTAAPTQEQLDVCASNNITPVTFNVGSQAVVLVANGASGYLSCLTPEQVGNVWRSQETLPTTWNVVGDTMPETAVTLFAPELGDFYADLLILTATGTAAPRRDDVAETNRDPLYRAAAVANVEGSLTFMSWAEYESVLVNGQDNIQLVSVNNGTDCVAPSMETIGDGTYPLSRQTQLIVRQNALATEVVQAFVWFMFSNDSVPAYQDAGLIQTSLATIREGLEVTFNEAEVAITIQPTPEVTPEGTSEPTPEATSQS